MRSKRALKDAGHNTNVGDEGGFAPDLRSADEALGFLAKAVEAAGYGWASRWCSRWIRPRASSIATGATSWRARARPLDAEGMVRFYEDLCARYPIRSIEDGMAEDDWDGWRALDPGARRAGAAGRRRSVRDQPRRSSPKASSAASPTRVLVKVNQIGTLSETLEAVELAQRAAYRCVMSHRSGETEDATIADLAVATNCGQIKTGSMSRSDRLAKYNQLLRIEEELGPAARFRRRAARWRADRAHARTRLSAGCRSARRATGWSLFAYGLAVYFGYHAVGRQSRAARLAAGEPGHRSEPSRSSPPCAPNGRRSRTRSRRLRPDFLGSRSDRRAGAPAAEPCRAARRDHLAG